ncbi:MAG: JAB domain-containing protein, partial [Streptococcus suis]|nr:JAB domain-containing protein [Streptococcus suis]
SYNTDNLVSIPSLIAKSSATVQEPVSQYITSGDPHLTKEHIWKAKAATRTYCNPILEGKKSGLWKNFRDFKKHGVLDILGANAEMEQGKITPQGWNQLATALQIYRDKRFETFRYLFVSPEGKIQDQLAVCSHLPGKTLSNLPSENLLGQVITHAEETGTKVVLVHNHPSGNITPSVDDIRMTGNTEAAFTRSDGKCLLAGHIILDHDSYSLYQKGKEWEARMLSPYDIYDPLLKTRNPMEGITVSGPESLELVAQAVNSHDKWKEEGWVPVVFTNSSSQISAVKMYPEDFLTQNNAKLLNQLQETAKRTGAVMAFPIILDKNHISQENQKNLLDRMKAGCFTDFYLGEKDSSFRTSEDFNLIPGKNLFDEVGMEQMAVHTTITSTFQRHQKQEMESLGLFVAEDTRKEYESFLGQIDDYLERGKTPSYHQFLISKTPRILTFTGLPDNEISLSTSVLNKAKKIHGLDNKEIMDSVKGLFNPILVFNSDKSTSEAKNDSVLVITEATAKNGKPVALALELEKKLTNRKPVYVVNDIRSIHDRNLVAQNGVDILKEWMDKGLLRYYDDKKISDWLAIKRVQFPLSLTKSDIDTVALKDNSVKTRTQLENSMVEKIHLESSLPEKLLTPAQIREGKHQLPVKQEFMENNSFFPPMERAKDGMVHLHCTTKDLSDGISLKNKPVVLKLTSKQAAVLIDASIKQRFMENRQAKQPEPLNIAAKNKMEESFFTGLKNVHSQLTRKEAEKQYHQVYSLIEKELKELRSEPAIEKKNPIKKGFSMEW